MASSSPEGDSSSATKITPLATFEPDLYQRAWQSIPHPSLPLLATPHGTSVTIFSLATLSKHSALVNGHTRSVRSVAWQPGLGAGQLRVVSGSFDSTAAVWNFRGDRRQGDTELEREVKVEADGEGEGEGEEEEDEWELTVVLEGHENEVKSVAFSPSGQFLATCSRDKSVWVWEDVSGEQGGDEDDGGEWDTVAVLSEHDGDVKAVAWCPDVPGRERRKGVFGVDVLASASYDNTVRIWREDGDGEWVCVAVLEGHEATAWGVQWETRPREDGKFPRLLTYSADGSVRVWELKVDEEEEVEARQPWSGIPNTMRRSLREDWVCTAVLPKVHGRDVYSVAWSAESGILASTGSDGVIALYAEDGDQHSAQDEDVEMVSPPAAEPAKPESDQQPTTTATDTNGTTQKGGWRVLTTIENAHGPYEINHITWCKRFDAGTDRKGIEEMLVTTGDDGLVKAWAVTLD